MRKKKQEPTVVAGTLPYSPRQLKFTYNIDSDGKETYYIQRPSSYMDSTTYLNRCEAERAVQELLALMGEVDTMKAAKPAFRFYT